MGFNSGFKELKDYENIRNCNTELNVTSTDQDFGRKD